MPGLHRARILRREALATPPVESAQERAAGPTEAPVEVMLALIDRQATLINQLQGELLAARVQVAELLAEVLRLRAGAALAADAEPARSAVHAGALAQTPTPTQRS